MNVLVLRLTGPMQSWGTQSRFTNRDTGLEPSKSGVIGLLCAALGWQRDQERFKGLPGDPSIEGFSRSLTMAVRVDREGRMSRDYHTALQVARSKTGMQDCVPSDRYFLADADFLVTLEGDRGLLERLDTAVRNPVWPLCLGRKSFVPSEPVAVAVRDSGLLAALSDEPWRKRLRWESPPDRLRLVVETPFGQGPEIRQDVPTGFDQHSRRHGHCTIRHVQTLFLPDPYHGLALPPVENHPCLLPQLH